MSSLVKIFQKIKSMDIALFLLGSFLCYIPLSMFTKMAGKGLFASLNGIPAGTFEILPMYAVGDVIASLAFFYISGWWRLMNRKMILGFSVPLPRWFTVVSGICIVVQIFTVLWAYAYNGISIVFAALLMKGGVLMIAPTVDLVSKKRKRKIYWPSWVAAALSLSALVIASSGGETILTLMVAVDILMYLLCYFIRLSIMSHWAKNDKPDDRKQFIIEEQMVIVFLLSAVLGIMAVIGSHVPGDNVLYEVYRGFIVLPSNGFVIAPITIGITAVGAGIFGTLVFLDRRENTFCVSAVHSMSVVAGTVATALIAFLYGDGYPGINKLIAVIIIITAIAFLSYRGSVEKRTIQIAAEEGAEI